MPMIPLWRMRSLGLPIAQFRDLLPAALDEDGDPLYEEEIVKSVMHSVLIGCHWIEGEVADQTWHFCGAGRKPGSVYCEAHFRRSVQSQSSEPGSKPRGRAKGSGRAQGS